jgi:hypothetical protein
MSWARLDMDFYMNCNAKDHFKRIALTAIACLLPVYAAQADTGNDFQQWTLLFVNHHLNEKWSASMQVENRLRDDASEVDKQVFKPGGYYRFTDTFQLGVGYKYVKKKDSKDEQDPWQELFFNPAPIGKWDWAHQFRWEQRTGDGLDGVVHRLRYLLHVTHPLGESGKYYFAAQEAVRFNAASKNSGPVDGFEQSRLYFGVGRKMSHKLKIEVGYLWNYQLERDGPDHSNHVFRLQFLMDTKGLHPFFAGS